MSTMNLGFVIRNLDTIVSFGKARCDLAPTQTALSGATEEEAVRRIVDIGGG